MYAHIGQHKGLFQSPPLPPCEHVQLELPFEQRRLSVDPGRNGVLGVASGSHDSRGCGA